MPDWQFCLVVWHGPVCIAKCRGWLATNDISSNILIPEFLAFYLNYVLLNICICIKYVHVHNRIIFSGVALASLTDLLYFSQKCASFTSPNQSINILILKEGSEVILVETNPFTFLLGGHLYHLHPCVLSPHIVFWVLVL